MQITVNGQSHTVAAEATIADLLGQLEVQPKFCAVERNEQLVPRARHGECRLEPGDRLEIVTLVGGG